MLRFHKSFSVFHNLGRKIKRGLQNSFKKTPNNSYNGLRLNSAGKPPITFNQHRVVPNLANIVQQRSYSSSTHPENKNWSWLKLVGVGTGIVSGLQLLLWLYEEKTQNATPVDIGWTYGIGALGILYATKGKGHPESRFLVGVVSTVWSFRLGTYLLKTRLMRDSEEDGRYKTLRKKWGEKASQNFFLFFQAQALADVLFSIPLLLCCLKSTRPGTLQKIATLLIGLGSVVGESLADYQLNEFKKHSENKGKVCKQGLWYYSRHPNYFFEFSHWWAYVILLFPSKFWPLSFISPITMLFLLFKVTGIPATEAQAISSKGEQYKEYQRTTSKFIPWFPKEEQKSNDK